MSAPDARGEAYLYKIAPNVAALMLADCGTTPLDAMHRFVVASARGTDYGSVSTHAVYAALALGLGPIMGEQIPLWRICAIAADGPAAPAIVEHRRTLERQLQRPARNPHYHAAIVEGLSREQEWDRTIVAALPGAKVSP